MCPIAFLWVSFYIDCTIRSRPGARRLEPRRSACSCLGLAAASGKLFVAARSRHRRSPRFPCERAAFHCRNCPTSRGDAIVRAHVPSDPYRVIARHASDERAHGAPDLHDAVDRLYRASVRRLTRPRSCPVADALGCDFLRSSLNRQSA
jgi:hypothetical protein